MTSHAPSAADAAARLHALQARADAIPTLSTDLLKDSRVKIYSASRSVILTCKTNPEDRHRLWFFDADNQPLIQANDIPRASEFLRRRLAP